MARYHLRMSPDGLAHIERDDGWPVGRALTQADGEQLVEELNGGNAAHMRDMILAAVTDAVEEAFEGGR